LTKISKEQELARVTDHETECMNEIENASEIGTGIGLGTENASQTVIALANESESMIGTVNVTRRKNGTERAGMARMAGEVVITVAAVVEGVAKLPADMPYKTTAAIEHWLNELDSKGKSKEYHSWNSCFFLHLFIICCDNNVYLVCLFRICSLTTSSVSI